MDFDRIITSSPVNATAARQTGKGEAWEPRVKLNDYYTEMPPLQKRLDAGTHANPEFVDFTGREFGRLLVLGLLVKKKRVTKSSWVCRCKCGYFCTRSSKSLKVADRGGNSFVPMCGRCKYQNDLRNGWTPNLKIKVKL